MQIVDVERQIAVKQKTAGGHSFAYRPNMDAAGKKRFNAGFQCSLLHSLGGVHTPIDLLPECTTAEYTVTLISATHAHFSWLAAGTP